MTPEEQELFFKNFKLACQPPSEKALTKVYAFGDDLPTWFEGHLTKEEIEKSIYKDADWTASWYLNKVRVGEEIRPW